MLCIFECLCRFDSNDLTSKMCKEYNSAEVYENFYLLTKSNCRLLSVVIKIMFEHVLQLLLPESMEQHFASNAEQSANFVS